MTLPAKPPFVAPILPENAPFSEEQRAWLNGFFAGLLSLDGSLTPAESVYPPEALKEMTGFGGEPATADPLNDGDDGSAPWHDQTMPMDDRMALAEGRPVRRRMMAAMAQQDCGQCGYDCETYANKIFLKEEERLNLCQPGGKPTARMLKKLFAEVGADATPAPAEPAAPSEAPGTSRENPVPVRFEGGYLLNKEGSQKETRHLTFDLSEAGLTYEPGDAFGLYPENEPGLVTLVMDRLKTDDPVMREKLAREYDLGEAPDALFELLAGHAEGADKENLLALAEGEDPDGDLETLDVLGALEKFPTLHPAAAQVMAVLEPLKPRLYSISSSPLEVPGKVDLTVDIVRYQIGERQRVGVASTFLADRLEAGAQPRVYIQPAHGFSLPADPATPIIMVGPGTGVAPFRAFLQHRAKQTGAGRAWLFYGHQHEACDFFYREEFEAYLASGVLSRLSTAWSRDGEAKVYVQDRLREAGAEAFEWLQEGAHFYICGDATRMAADVEKALVEIYQSHGGHDEAGAKAAVQALIEAGRYQKDVY